MDPLHPILPPRPNILPVPPAAAVTRIEREREQRGRPGDERRRRRAAPPQPPAPALTTEDEDTGGDAPHIDVTA